MPHFIFWKPLQCSRLKIFTRVNDDCAADRVSKPLFLLERREIPYNCLPSFLDFILSTAEVFLLIFLFPTGVSVDRQVWQGGASGGAVRHPIRGTLVDDPVPRKVNSTSPRVCMDPINKWNDMRYIVRL